jgi:periplasmic protein TonB
MILRSLAIWGGVGFGHLAVLGTLWSGQPSLGPTDVPLRLDLRFVPVEGARAPSPIPAPLASPCAPSPASSVVTPAPTSSVAPGAPVARPLASPLPAAPLPAAAPGTSATPTQVSPPRFLERVEPPYPSRARRAGVEGVVSLRLRLSERGELLQAEVARSSGSELLDAAALAAARASRFLPADAAGRPVPSETEATYRFELR